MAEPITLEAPVHIDDLEARRLANAFEGGDPRHLLQWAIGSFGRRLVLATSFQADGMVLLDMAWRIDPTIRVVSVDTGRLPQETYDLIDQVRDRYALPIEVFSPKADTLEQFVGEHGPNPFYKSLELRVGCCDIRKVAPLTRALAGRRRLDHRAAPRPQHHAARHWVVERDDAHGGIVKLNPLAAWNDEQVWELHPRQRRPLQRPLRPGVHQHRLRAVHAGHAPGDDPRAGRWWWEQRRAEGVRHALRDRLEFAAGVRRDGETARRRESSRQDEFRGAGSPPASPAPQDEESTKCRTR